MNANETKNMLCFYVQVEFALSLPSNYIFCNNQVNSYVKHISLASHATVNHDAAFNFQLIK